MKAAIHAALSRLKFLRWATWLEVCAGLFMVGTEAGGGEYVGAASTSQADVLLLCNGIVVGVFALRIGWRGVLIPRSLVEPGTFVAMIATIGLWLVSIRIAAALALIHDVLRALAWLRRDNRRQQILVDVGYRPARSLVLSFLGLIAVGTVLLLFPASRGAEPIAFVDALFTAISATCVTGLVTVDTAVAWSPFGQGVICVLFQLGGLGIMVLGAAVSLALGQTLGPTGDAAVRGVFDESNAEELRQLLRNVVVWTLVIEAVAACFLFVRFLDEMPASAALVSAVFHAVSAFCNAGFSIYSDSLSRFASDPVVNAILIGLITMGGLGFGVLMGAWRYVSTRGAASLSIHAKVVLVSSGILVVAGWLLFFFFEYDRSLAHLGFGGKVIASLFQSVTTRTAGFNTVSLELLHPLTILVMIALMLVGASPGSTGGGLKTTTIALVFLAVRSFLTESQHVEVFGRRVAHAQVLRALALTGTAVICYVLALGILLITETKDFAALAFETASALGTVGLTLGVTPKLSFAGKLVVAVLMFVGRVGPLTVVAAMARRREGAAQIALPEGKVLVG